MTDDHTRGARSGSPTRVIDARGHRCPTPALKLRRALAGCSPGEVIELWADDPMVKIDIPHLVRSLGDEIVYSDLTEVHSIFWVRKTSSVSGGGATEVD
jgi:tRNA 2-thiouridine synthesizing protein A